MAGTDTIVGQSGLMPEDLYLRKIESSCVFEDDFQVENYQRNLLKDFRPDPYFFESDAPRRNYQSTAAIDLRDSGKRVQTDPYLPDGLNINYDPWVLDTPAGVDYQKGVAQQKARAKLIKFYPDSDNSIPESGINITQMVQQIKNAMPWVQNRLKIFETSKDNIQHGFLAQTKACEVKKYEKDSVIPHINECQYRTRIGNTSAFSNDSHLGFRTDTDHPFRIARYGMVKAGSPATDYYNNREGTYIDHRLPISFEGKNISPDLALLMVDLVRKKAADHQRGRDNLVFPNSIENTNKSIKTPTDEGLLMARENVVQTANLAAHLLHEGKMISTPGLIPSAEFNRYYQTIIDPEVVEFIASLMSNRKMAPRETDDLRSKIEKTATESGIYVADKSQVRKTGPMVYETFMVRESLNTHQKTESKKVFNYASLPAQNPLALQSFYDPEAYKTYSKERRTNLGNTQLNLPQTLKITTPDSRENAMAGLSKTRISRGLGKKYNLPNMDREIHDHVIGT